MDKNIILDNLSLWVNLGVGAVLWYINSRFAAIKKLIDNETKAREKLEKHFEECQKAGEERGRLIARMQGRMNGDNR